jgi:hypothetical protein
MSQAWLSSHDGDGLAHGDALCHEHPGRQRSCPPARMREVAGISATRRGIDRLALGGNPGVPRMSSLFSGGRACSCSWRLHAGYESTGALSQTVSRSSWWRGWFHIGAPARGHTGLSCSGREMTLRSAGGFRSPVWRRPQPPHARRVFDHGRRRRNPPQARGQALADGGLAPSSPPAPVSGSHVI